MITNFNSNRVSKASDDDALNSGMINTGYVCNCDWRVMVADHNQVTLAAVQLNANGLPISVKCIGFIGENTYRLLANVDDPAELQGRQLGGDQFINALIAALDMHAIKLLDTSRGKDVYLFGINQPADAPTQTDTASSES